MTQLDERISLELEWDLMALFNEEEACEVPNHAERPEIHEGGGEWYIISGPCSHCGGLDADEVVLVCDKFKKTVERLLYDSTVPCGLCGKRCLTADILIGFERRGASPVDS